jgi:hypothetical protein
VTDFPVLMVSFFCCERLEFFLVFMLTLPWGPGIVYLNLEDVLSYIDSPPDSAEVKKNVDLYINSLIRLNGVVLN